ncbi:MAG: hypothetical protein KatS3mg002_1446 [Candidatus Woesearchaeota archaeon]|nr:MAG: hypothetical protein KatS3mg002_1446 [Candidatus Woesearchaeota archaeon]
MKHKCTKCKKIYDDKDIEIINGCSCGNNRFFFFNENKKISKPKNLNKKNIIESDIEFDHEKDSDYEYFEIDDEDNNEIILMDTETISIIKEGKYVIDIQSLLNNNAPIYKYGEGKYSIDLNNFMRKKTN